MAFPPPGPGPGPLPAALVGSLHAAATAGDVGHLASALAAASAAGHAPYATVAATKGAGGTLLMKAAHAGHLAAVELLLEHGAAVDGHARDETYNTTALMMACAAGHDEVVAALCAAGCDVCLLDMEGRSALLHAARRGHRRACELLLASDAALAPEMIGQADETGLTPLAAAAVNNHLGAVNLLLAEGAGLERADEVGRTALMGASFKGLDEIVVALLDAGADTRAEDVDGLDAAAWAEEGGHDAIAEMVRSWVVGGGRGGGSDGGSGGGEAQGDGKGDVDESCAVVAPSCALGPAAISDGSAEQRDALARRDRVAKLREQWRKDKAAGKLPPPLPRPPPAPHPVEEDIATRGVPMGCVPRFVPPPTEDGSELTLMARGMLIAAAVERRAAEEQLEAMVEVPVVHEADLIAEGDRRGEGRDSFFLSTYALRGRPCVIKGAMEEGWDRTAFEPDALVQRFGSHAWTARRGEDYGRMESVTTTLAEYVQAAKHGQTAPNTGAAETETEAEADEAKKKEKGRDKGKGEDQGEAPVAGGGAASAAKPRRRVSWDPATVDRSRKARGRLYGANNQVHDGRTDRTTQAAKTRCHATKALLPPTSSSLCHRHPHQHPPYCTPAGADWTRPTPVAAAVRLSAALLPLSSHSPLDGAAGYGRAHASRPSRCVVMLPLAAYTALSCCHHIAFCPFLPKTISEPKYAQEIEHFNVSLARQATLKHAFKIAHASQMYGSSLSHFQHDTAPR